jgi:hypothetical protein
MSEPSQSTHGGLNAEPVGPVGRLIADAIAALPCSRSEAAMRIKHAAVAIDGVKNPTCSKSSFHRWIYQGTIPDPAMCRWISAGLHIPRDRLADAIHAQRALLQEQTEDATSAPDTVLPTTMDLPDVAVSTEPEVAERLDYALKHPARLDSVTLSHLEQVLVVLEAIERNVEADALIGAVLGHLNVLVNLLRGVLPSDARRYLCSIAGETACLAARLYTQLSNAPRARGYFNAGLSAAREAQDHALVAYLLGIMAGQLAYRHDPRSRLELLRSCSPQHASPVTRVFLAAKEADAHALLGDSDSCHTALSQAETHLSLVGDDTAGNRPRAPWWPQELWLAGEQGATLARLGEYRQAEGILTIVLAKNLNAKHRLWLTVALARVRAGSRQPDEASRLAIEVLVHADPLQMTSVVHEVAYLHSELSPWKELPPVRDLDELLHQAPRLSGSSDSVPSARPAD